MKKILSLFLIGIIAAHGQSTAVSKITTVGSTQNDILNGNFNIPSGTTETVKSGGTLTLNGTLNGSFVVPVANGGTASTTARNASNSVATQFFTGGISWWEDMQNATPSFQWQIGTDESGAAIPYMWFSNSTTQGDWLHGFQFPTGIPQVGDTQFMDPSFLGSSVWCLNGSPAGATATGDSALIIQNMSSSSSNSGSSVGVAVMTEAPSTTQTGTWSGTTNTITLSGSNNNIVPGQAITGTNIAANTIVRNVSGITLKISKNTTGSGSGVTLTFTGGNAALAGTFGGINYNGFAGCTFTHVPDNRGVGLLPGNAMIVMNKHATYLKGFAICSPGLSGFDAGNYSAMYVDLINKTFDIPFWVAGAYQPSDAGWQNALQTHMDTGVTSINGATTITARGNASALTAVSTAGVTGNYTITAKNDITSFSGLMMKDFNGTSAMAIAYGNPSAGGFPTACFIQYDINGAGANFYLQDQSTGKLPFEATTTGHILINTTTDNGVDAIQINGNVNAAGNLISNLLGSGLQIKGGSNGRIGINVALSGGSVTVSNTSLTSADMIIVSQHTPGGTVQAPYVSARTDGTGFTVSGGALNTGTIDWMIVRGN